MSQHQNGQEPIPLYKSHEGTLRISGSTVPRRAGLCAFHYLHEKVPSVEFLAIGANANHNAMKAMGIFLKKVEEENNGEVTVSFQPRRYKTVVYEGNESKLTDCVVWYTVIHALTDDNENDDPEQPAEEGTKDSPGI
jgi:hypothetical protein